MRMLEIHSMIWSEPLFLTFTLISLLFLSDYLTQQKIRYLLYSAIAGSLAFLTRYAGASLIGTGIVSIFLFSRQNLARRFLHSVIFGVIASASSLIIFAQTHLQTEGQTIQFYPPSYEQLNSFLYTISTWLVPESVPGIMKRTALFFFVIGFALAAIRFWRLERNTQNSQTFITGALTAIFIFFYVLILFLTMTLYWASLPLDARILSPVFVTLVILTTVMLSRAYLLETASLGSKLFVASLCIAIAFGYVTQSVPWLIQIHDNGQGYTSREWQQSQIVETLAELPLARPIFTNEPYALSFLSARTIESIPAKVDVVHARTSANYQMEFLRMKNQMERDHGYLIYFYDVPWSDTQARENELVNELHLQQIKRSNKGVIYQAR
jgi:hypothetical protein